MRTFERRARFLPLLLVILPAAALLAQSSQDDRDVREIGAQIQEAWNKSDAKLLAALWLTDGDYISSTGRTARGRDEVEKAFAEQWGGIYKGTKIAHTLTNVHFLRKDVAVADGAFEVSGMRDASGKVLGSRSGLSTIVAARKGTRWYIAALRGMVPSVPLGSPGK
ncbi:MAG TPA: SgcJ/EcaC family oxidoreductase [Thermoanaerobaculia bacterium]